MVQTTPISIYFPWSEGCSSRWNATVQSDRRYPGIAIILDHNLPMTVRAIPLPLPSQHHTPPSPSPHSTTHTHTHTGWSQCKTRSTEHNNKRRNKNDLTLKAPITTAADDILKYCFFFLIFQRKQFLIFHVNRLPSRRFTWNIKTCFLWKIKNKIKSKCRLLQILLRALRVKNKNQQNKTKKTTTKKQRAARERGERGWREIFCPDKQCWMTRF